MTPRAPLHGLRVLAVSQFGAGPFGLPLSVQLVGPHRDDDQLVAWARWVEQRLS